MAAPPPLKPTPIHSIPPKTAAIPRPEDVFVRPETCIFACGMAGHPTYCDIKVRNDRKERLAFKMRCTTGPTFRVLPSLGFIAPKSSFVIRLWYQNKVFCDSKKHYFAMHVIYNDTATNPAELFQKGTVANGVIRIPIVFSKSVPQNTHDTTAVAPKSLMMAPVLPMTSVMGTVSAFGTAPNPQEAAVPVANLAPASAPIPVPTPAPPPTCEPTMAPPPSAP